MFLPECFQQCFKYLILFKVIWLPVKGNTANSRWYSEWGRKEGECASHDAMLLHDVIKLCLLSSLFWLRETWQQKLQTVRWKLSAINYIAPNSSLDGPFAACHSHFFSPLCFLSCLYCPLFNKDIKAPPPPMHPVCATPKISESGY